MSNVVDIATGKPLVESEPEDFGYSADEIDGEILRLGVQGLQREWHLSLAEATRWFVTAGGRHLRSIAS